MGRRGTRQPGVRRTAQRSQRRVRDLDNEGLIPVLARAVREVETAIQRGSVMSSVRTKFQVVGLLVREERARVRADTDSTEAQRNEQLKRLDGVATILAKTAARDTSLLALLAEDAEVSSSAKALRREMLAAAGLEAPSRAGTPRQRSWRLLPPPSAGSSRSRSSPASSPTPSWPPTSPTRPR